MFFDTELISKMLVPFLTSVSVGYFVTPVVIWIYRRFGWVDDPKKNNHAKNIHTKPVPRGGGLSIFIAVLVGMLMFLPIDKHLIGIFLGALVLMITGVFDDILDIHPKIRIVIGFLAAGCVVASGIGIPFLTNPLREGLIYLNEPQIAFYLFGKTRTIWILADIFALFWIVGIMNFVNWSKGLDGQLPGMTGVAAITIAFLSLQFSADITQWATAVLAVIVAGAYFGFLPWNVFPQKIMPGYGGGSLAGYFLAVMAILSTTKVGTLVVVLGVPLIDAGFVMIRRIMAGKSPIWGDTRHLHHALLKIGWTKKQVAFFYWGVTAFLGMLSLNLNSQQKFYTIVVIIIAFAAFLLWIKQFASSSRLRGQDSG